MKVDLHTHTNASDGSLSPIELLRLAEDQGVELLAITDHDTLDAYQHLPASTPIRIVPGIELSTHWTGIGVHILGLNIDLADDTLKVAVNQQKQSRINRAKQIAQRLHRRHGIDFRGDVDHTQPNTWLGRPDFAKAMVRAGIVETEAAAFKRYLGRGKVGDIKTEWPPLGNIVNWITQCGGTPVLAHPLSYKLTNAKLGRLLHDFKRAGGQAIEVISGPQDIQRTNYLARLSIQHDLLASAGSDFHRPSKWSLPGRIAQLPTSCLPVWQQW